jgi:histidinol dehydrogenase
LQILNWRNKNFDTSMERILSNSRDQGVDISDTVASIIDEVVTAKDKGLIRLTKQFDNIYLKPENFMVSQDEINLACDQVTTDQRNAVDLAVKRIRAFHKRQLPEDIYWTDSDGIEMGWRWQPIERVGIYVPGGTASYPSSVLMNAIPASIAGSKEIIMVSPARNGRINPLVLYAARVSGVDQIYKIGGAQAIAALAYGTETIKPVHKITGPGNSFVAEAKKQVFGHVGIDMVAGPSEIIIIADKENNPEWIAADLLSQAEHDESSQSILITTSESLAAEVNKVVSNQLLDLERKKIASASWEKNGAIIVVESLEQAVALSNQFAPEHLQVCVRTPDILLDNIKNAGSIFLGSSTPEAMGDYIIGTNHVLPTGKSARYSSGLSVLDFMKRSSISKVPSSSVDSIVESAATLAKAEGLGAHELSLNLRISEFIKTSRDDL